MNSGVLGYGGSGRVETSVGPPTHFAPGAVPITIQRFLAVRVGGVPVNWNAGLPHDELGRFIIAPNNTNPIAGYVGGIAITAAGRIAIDTDGPIHHYVRGIPVNVDGRVCINVPVAASETSLADLDGDANPDTVLLDTNPGGPDVTIDSDSINVDIDGDGDADVIVPR